jgi:NAD(P)-dependent dehydrogenase (short-subunit alcohol dehydrogenase family)
MVERAEASLTPEQFEAIKAAHPLGIGSPWDVAHAIAFLVADTGRWITGTTLVVDGGYTAH